MQHCYCTTPSWHDVLEALTQLTECTATQCAEPNALHAPPPIPSLFEEALLFLLPLALAVFLWYILPPPGGGEKPHHLHSCVS